MRRRHTVVPHLAAQKSALHRCTRISELDLRRTSVAHRHKGLLKKPHHEAVVNIETARIPYPATPAAKARTMLNASNNLVRIDI